MKVVEYITLNIYLICVVGILELRSHICHESGGVYNFEHISHMCSGYSRTEVTHMS